MGAPVLPKCLFLWVTDFSLKSGDLRDDPGFPVWFTPHGGRGTNRSKVCWFLGLRKGPASLSRACLSRRSGACFFAFLASGSQDPTVQTKFQEDQLPKASLEVRVLHFDCVADLQKEWNFSLFPCANVRSTCMAGQEQEADRTW